MNIQTGKYWDRPLSLVDGCTPCSPGCDHCWSKALAERFGRWPEKVTFRKDRLDIPMKTRKPTVFSVWNDLFHEEVTEDFLGTAYGMMALCPQRTFLILTKRASRLAEYWGYEWRHALIEGSAQKIYHDRTGENPSMWLAVHNLPNVWHGVTVCNQSEADAKIPELLKVPGHKWLSIEPCLDVIKLKPGLWIPPIGGGPTVNLLKPWETPPDPIEWVVIGAETGPKRRPCPIINIQNIVAQCQWSGIPVWVKAVDLGKKVSHDMNEFPEGLRIRQVPWTTNP